MVVGAGGEGKEIAASCITDVDTGICSVVLEGFPAAWFDGATTAVVRVGFGEGEGAFTRTYSAFSLDTLQEEPIALTFAPRILHVPPPRDVMITLPVAPLSVGQEFTVNVVANTGSKAGVAGFELRCDGGAGTDGSNSGSGSLELLRIDANLKKWAVSSAVEDGSGAIAARLQDPMALPHNAAEEGDAETLATLTFRVRTSAPAGGSAAVGCRVRYLGNAQGEKVFPAGEGVVSGSDNTFAALVADRASHTAGNGMARIGEVHFAAGAVTHLLAIASTEIANFAIFSRQRVVREVRLLATTDAGAVVPVTADVACRSHDDEILKVGGNCRIRVGRCWRVAGCP